MRIMEKNDARRLIPATPPQRLPEEALLSELKHDKVYRRNASLLRGLLYRPQRLFTSGAPSRLPPAKTLRELRYRLVAVVTSLALLVGMVNFAPFNFLSLVGTSKAAAAAAPDYSWLTSYDGTTADTAYQISTPNQLHALALLVAGLAPSDVATLGRSVSDSPTMEITIDGYTFIVGPDQEDVLPPAFSSDTPEVPEVSPSIVPSATPPVTPTDKPTSEPTAAPTTEPTTEPTMEPTAEPTTEPSQTPPVESSSPSTEPSPAPTVEPSVVPTAEPSAEVPAEVQPLALSLRSAMPMEHVEDSTPTPSPSEDAPQPSAPKESEEPAPSEPVAPTPSASHSPEPSPSDSAEPSPSASESPSPSQSEEVTPPPSPTDSQPTETAPVPTNSTPVETTPPPEGGNSLPFPDSGVEARVYSLNVPTGMQGRFFKLTADLSLYLYRGRVGADQGERVYWTPIGIMEYISSGTPKGAPFLGTFDGANHVITDFYYAPDPAALDLDFTTPTPTMSSYGLFGYVGTGAIVKNLTIRTVDTKTSGSASATPIPWNLSVLSPDTPKNVSLGAVECALAVLAGAVSGTLENCAVSQTYMSYWYKDNWPNTASPVSIGGIAGLVSGGTLTGCTFLGGIKAVTNNDSGTATDHSALQCVGGVAGRVAGSAASTFSKCASGVDIDIHNGTLLNQSGGIGGLYGYNSAAVTVSESFTTGVVRAWHDAGGLGGKAGGKVTVSDSYSTVAVGKASSTLNAAAAASPLAYSPLENMGGLFGAISGGSSSLKNTYFAGSLLEPQFGSVAGGMTASSPVFTNVAVDATQVPHSFFKDQSDPPSIHRNLTGIEALAPVDGAAATLWVKSTVDALPQLTWSQTYESDGSTPTTVQNLSKLAAKRWAILSSANAISGTDGQFSFYRLKDDVSGKAPADLGLLTLSSDTRYYNSDKSVITGGEYSPKSTADATVGGVSVPILRSAITAINQTEGQADTISSGAALVRFANRVNLAPGGYNGSQYLFTTFDAGGVTIPTYGKNTIKLFCGTLTGGAGAVVSNFGYASGASGLIDTGCDAMLQNFTLANISIGDVPLGTDSGYCGFAVGQVIRTNLTNVDINTLAYAYSGDAYAKQTNIGLIGQEPLVNTSRLLITDCDVTDFNFSAATSGNNLYLFVGGILGFVEGSGSGQSFTMTNCTMSGSIKTAFQNSSATTNYPNIGGLLGHDNDSFSSGKYAYFTRCTVNADLSGVRVGGLAGRARSAEMTNCVFYGTISTSKNYTNTGHSLSASGGLIGANQHGSATINIKNCAVFGTVSSRYDAGGFIGYTQKAPIITSSYASAIVSADLKGGAAGGMMGYHDASNDFSATGSYFTGQVLSPDTKGAIIGLTKAAKITLVNTFYDRTLFPDGTKTVGSAPTDTIVADCAARPNDTIWNNFTTAGGWVYSGSDRHYPQLSWLKNALPTLSDYSTLQLFDVESLSSIHNIPLGTTFHTMLPTDGGISGIPAPKGEDGKIPFIQEGDITVVDGYTATPYLTNDADVTEGLLEFTYTGMGPKGSSVTLPYMVGIKLFEQGSGTRTDPYIIYDLSQLLIFRAFINSSKNAADVYYQVSERYPTDGTYKSVTIDMVDDKGAPLDWRGTTSALLGHLDGHGSTLTNFYTTGWTVTSGVTKTWYAGLVGSLAPGSEVFDLTILGAERGAITGPSGLPGGSHAAGILSATAGGGTIRGVTVQGKMNADLDVHVGGLIGSVTATAPLSVSRCVSDVNISSNNEGSGSGAGGLIGDMSAASITTAVISECATYGSIQDWGAVGGLVGRVNNAGGLSLEIANSYSLTNFTDINLSASVLCGGILGSADNLISNQDSNRIIIDSCYYAGENDMSGGSGRTVGGFIGGATASISGQGSELKGNGRDYLKLNIKNSAFNSDSNTLPYANLYCKGFNSRYAWPEVYYDGDGPVASDGYGTVFNGVESSFSMSQDEADRQGSMASWDAANTWSFDNGLYPRLKNVPIDSKLAFAHLAIHYTKAGGTDRYANIFVRYTGATMSLSDASEVLSSGSLKVTDNKRMAVAINNETTAPAPITITATIDGVEAKHTIHIIPSVDSTGYRDTSIYYANPDGMWPGTDGQKVWRVYTADALAGLSTIFSSDIADQNGIPQPASYVMTGGQVWLARDIDLGQAYTGMTDYNTWRSIGSSKDTAFDITLDGKGHTLYNLVMNPFYRHSDGGKNYTYYDLNSGSPVPATMSGSFGLFGYINGGTIQNLVLAASSSSADKSVYTQPGIRVAQGVTAAGALAATAENATLKNCLVSIPVYTMGDTPAYSATDTEIWDKIPHLGAAQNVPMGGLVGQVLGTVNMENCAYTGYVYADPKSPRPGSGSPASTDLAGPVGGLVGRVSAGAALTVSDSYAAGYVHGAQTGALVGANFGTVALSGASYDQNAAGGGAPSIGAKTDDSSVTGSAAPQVPALIGADWEANTPAGLDPVQSALTAYSGTLAARIRIALTPHASSATGGTLSYTANGSSLVYNAALQPAVAVVPGSVVMKDNSFAKQTDGLVQLELTQDASARRVLVNLRCWYDDYTETDGIKHYTISTAEELWELSQIVSGAIVSSEQSKVAHTHAPAGGFDTFSGAVIHLADDIDLTTLTDTVDNATRQRPWLPIGSTHAFAGTLLGNGHSVSGLLLADVAEAGLFGTVSGTKEAPACVQDLLVTNAALTLSAAPNAVGGLLCANLGEYGKLVYCGASGTASASGSGATLGGIVGSNQGVVEGCFSTVELTSSATGYVGGIAGSISGASAAVSHSYFTGYANALNASTGGIAGDNTGATVSDCYVSAYLTGKVIYRAAKNAENCVYDGRHVGTLNDTDTATARQDGASLTMVGDWTENSGTYYPIPLYYTLPASSSPDIVGSTLARAAKLAAGIFTFSGASNSSYGRFSTVSVAAVSTGVSFLRSGNASLLSVSGNEAHTVAETSGDVVLRFCLGADGQSTFQRPCWLTIPSALAVTYRFNWEELITKYPDDVTANADYHTGFSSTNTWSSAGYSHTISTAGDWTRFTEFANNNSTVDHTFTLDYDINFSGAAISTVTAPFYGTFNGGNHTLSNFSAGAPLFAGVEQGAKVEYLGISKGTVTISARGTLDVGVVAGRNAGRIANVSAEYCKLTIIQNSAAAVTSAGSLVGQNTGMLDSCYYYVTGTVGDIQMSVDCPAGTALPSLRMGGLAGYNTGTVKGCYSTLSMSLTIDSGLSTHFASLVGLNDGGSILYSYWRYPYTYSGASDTYAAYVNSDGTRVLARDLFLGNDGYTERTARWLSADSYGGTYYVSDGHLMLYSFRLARYDFSKLLGTPMQQYLMLGLQFDSPASGALFSNAVCSWKGPVLPNFADLPLTSSLSVRLPILSEKLTYSLPNVYVIHKDTKALGQMGSATIGGSAQSGYSVTSLGDNATRVFLDVKLEKATADDQRWGVYRKDSTLPEILN